MKKHVSPTAAVLCVVLTFGAVLTYYWKGLLGLGAPEEMGPMGGGGMAMPPPPIVGLPTVAVSTLAGPAPSTPQAGDAGFADEPGAKARFDGPSSISIAPDGSLVVSDTRNHRLRRVCADGAVSTVAGSGPTAAPLGALADGPADKARLWNPSGLAHSPSGGVFIADTGNHRVRRYDASGIITLAGSDTPTDRLGLADGGLADGSGDRAQFRYPIGVVALSDGSALVVDTGNRRLRKVTVDGTVSTVADLGAAGARSPCDVTVMADGAALVTDPAVEAIFHIATDGRVSTVPGIAKEAPIWIRPTGIACGSDGTVYVTDAGSHCVMRLIPGAQPQVIAGIVQVDVPAPGYANGTGEQAMFAAPCDLVVAGPNVLYVADYGNNCIRKLTLGG